MKNHYQVILSFVLVVFGVLLIIVAFCVPPKGVIDATVLTAYGETLTFAGSLIGLDYHYRVKGASRTLSGLSAASLFQGKDSSRNSRT